MSDVAWVGLAGAAGATTRWWVDGMVSSRARSQIPMATVAINVSGSLLLGLLTGLVVFHNVTPTVTLVAGTGFCGGYTTFSTASVEVVRLLHRRAYGAAASTTAIMASLTLGAAALGLALASL